MKVLLLGGAGFIGQHLAAELRLFGYEVGIVDTRVAAEQDLLRAGVCDQALTEHQPDHVVHLAAQVGRLFGENDPDYTIRSNAVMTTLVAQACARHGVTLTYASTSEVYGDQGERVCKETTPVRLPHNLYGLSKWWGEQACQLYHQAAGLQVVRLSMPFGPGLPAGLGRAAIVNMLAQADAGEPIIVHDGAARCWCWVGDTVRGIRLVIEQGEQRTREVRDDVGVYNIGRDDNEMTMLDVARLACHTVGKPENTERIEVVQAPPNQTVVKRLASEKIRALGWQPEVGIAEGMIRTWDTMRTPQPRRT